MPEMKDHLPTENNGVSYLLAPNRAAIEDFVHHLGQVVANAAMPHLRRLENLDTYWQDALASLMAKDNTFYLPTWGVREPPRPPLQYYPVFFPEPAILAGRLMGDQRYLDLATKIESDWVAYVATVEKTPDLAADAQELLNRFRSHVKAITALSNSQESHPPGH